MIINICLFLLSCENVTGDEKSEPKDPGENIHREDNVEGQEYNMDDKDVYGFENIGKAPKAKEDHPLDKVIKVFFNETTFDDPNEPIAINVKDNEIYVNPSLSLHSYSSYDKKVKINDTEQVLEILKQYDVQNWKEDFSFEDPETYEDGYSWRVWLQYEDGTVEKHKGKGTNEEQITPDNFNHFVKDLTSFIEKD